MSEDQNNNLSEVKKPHKDRRIIARTISGAMMYRFDHSLSITTQGKAINAKDENAEIKFDVVNNRRNEVLEAYKDTENSVNNIAVRFKVCEGTINNIVNSALKEEDIIQKLIPDFQYTTDTQDLKKAYSDFRINEGHKRGWRRPDRKNTAINKTNIGPSIENSEQKEQEEIKLSSDKVKEKEKLSIKSGEQELTTVQPVPNGISIIGHSLLITTSINPNDVEKLADFISGYKDQLILEGRWPITTLSFSGSGVQLLDDETTEALNNTCESIKTLEFRAGSLKINPSTKTNPLLKFSNLSIIHSYGGSPTLSYEKNGITVNCLRDLKQIHVSTGGKNEKFDENTKKYRERITKLDDACLSDVDFASLSLTGGGVFELGDNLASRKPVALDKGVRDNSLENVRGEKEHKDDNGIEEGTITYEKAGNYGRLIKILSEDLKKESKEEQRLLESDSKKKEDFLRKYFNEPKKKDQDKSSNKDNTPSENNTNNTENEEELSPEEKKKLEIRHRDFTTLVSLYNKKFNGSSSDKASEDDLSHFIEVLSKPEIKDKQFFAETLSALDIFSAETLEKMPPSEAKERKTLQNELVFVVQNRSFRELQSFLSRNPVVSNAIQNSNILNVDDIIQKNNSEAVRDVVKDTILGYVLDYFLANEEDEKQIKKLDKYKNALDNSKNKNKELEEPSEDDKALEKTEKEETEAKENDKAKTNGEKNDDKEVTLEDLKKDSEMTPLIMQIDEAVDKCMSKIDTNWRLSTLKASFNNDENELFKEVWKKLEDHKDIETNFKTTTLLNLDRITLDSNLASLEDYYYTKYKYEEIKEKGKLHLEKVQQGQFASWTSNKEAYLESESRNFDFIGKSLRNDCERYKKSVETLNQLNDVRVNCENKLNENNASLEELGKLVKFAHDKQKEEIENRILQVENKIRDTTKVLSATKKLSAVSEKIKNSLSLVTEEAMASTLEDFLKVAVTAESMGSGKVGNSFAHLGAVKMGSTALAGRDITSVNNFLQQNKLAIINVERMKNEYNEICQYLKDIKNSPQKAEEWKGNEENEKLLNKLEKIGVSLDEIHKAMKAESENFKVNCYNTFFSKFANLDNGFDVEKINAEISSTNFENFCQDYFTKVNSYRDKVLALFKDPSNQILSATKKDPKAYKAQDLYENACGIDGVIKNSVGTFKEEGAKEEQESAKNILPTTVCHLLKNFEILTGNVPQKDGKKPNKPNLAAFITGQGSSFDFGSLAGTRGINGVFEIPDEIYQEEYNKKISSIITVNGEIEQNLKEIYSTLTGETNKLCLDYNAYETAISELQNSDTQRQANDIRSYVGTLLKKYEDNSNWKKSYPTLESYIISKSPRGQELQREVERTQKNLNNIYMQSDRTDEQVQKAEFAKNAATEAFNDFLHTRKTQIGKLAIEDSDVKTLAVNHEFTDKNCVQNSNNKDPLLFTTRDGEAITVRDTKADIQGFKGSDILHARLQLLASGAKKAVGEFLGGFRHMSVFESGLYIVIATFLMLGDILKLAKRKFQTDHAYAQVDKLTAALAVLNAVENKEISITKDENGNAISATISDDARKKLEHLGVTLAPNERVFSIDLEKATNGVLSSKTQISIKELENYRRDSKGMKMTDIEIAQSVEKKLKKAQAIVDDDIARKLEKENKITAKIIERHQHLEKSQSDVNKAKKQKKLSPSGYSSDRSRDL